MSCFYHPNREQCPAESCLYQAAWQHCVSCGDPGEEQGGGVQLRSPGKPTSHLPVSVSATSIGPPLHIVPRNQCCLLLYNWAPPCLTVIWLHMCHTVRFDNQFLHYYEHYYCFYIVFSTYIHFIYHIQCTESGHPVDTCVKAERAESCLADIYNITDNTYSLHCQKSRQKLTFHSWVVG